jgi:hypothetical protein
MKYALTAIAACVGLSLGLSSTTATAANNHPPPPLGGGSGYVFGYGYGYDYPYVDHRYNYYPNFYEYYAPHASHDLPYNFSLFEHRSSYLVCNTVITVKVYWRNHKKHVVKVPLRSCYRVDSD